MINCSKVIISAIEGVAVGAGLAAAFMADISVVGKNARILDGHTKLGVAAGDHAAIIWPLLGYGESKVLLVDLRFDVRRRGRGYGLGKCLC